MDTAPLLADFHLCPLQSSDAAEIFEAIDTQRQHLGRWLPFVAQTHHRSQTEEVVAAMLANPENPIFTIRHQTQFAGLIGFKAANRATGTIEIGYWLREEHQGKGLITAAVRELCRLAFEQMGFKQVEIHCAQANLRSNAVPLRLGFRLDRILPQGELLSDGNYTDLNVYRLDRQL